MKRSLIAWSLSLSVCAAPVSASVFGIVLLTFSDPGAAVTVQPGDTLLIEYNLRPIPGQNAQLLMQTTPTPLSAHGGCLVACSTTFSLYGNGGILLDSGVGGAVADSGFPSGFNIPQPSTTTEPFVLFSDTGTAFDVTAFSLQSQVGPPTNATLFLNPDPSMIPSIAAAPLPAALPLFATGFAAMGLLGWWRKRKNNRKDDAALAAG